MDVIRHENNWQLGDVAGGSHVSWEKKILVYKVFLCFLVRFCKISLYFWSNLVMFKKFWQIIDVFIEIAYKEWGSGSQEAIWYFQVWGRENWKENKLLIC